MTPGICDAGSEAARSFYTMWHHLLHGCLYTMCRCRARSARLNNIEALPEAA